jgi:hypothetical protein
MLMEFKIRRVPRRKGYRRGMAGMGAAAPAPNQRQTDLQRYFTAVRASHQKSRLAALELFKRSITFKQYADEMKRQAGVASSLRLLAERHATLLPSQRAELAGVTQRVTDAWKVATQQAAKTPNNKITPLTARGYVEQLYGWLDRVAGQVQTHLLKTKPLEHAVQTVKDLPGDLLTYAAEQLKKPLAAMGIPSWVIPVAGGLLLLGLAAPLLGPALGGLSSLARTAGARKAG